MTNTEIIEKLWDKYPEDMNRISAKMSACDTKRDFVAKKKYKDSRMKVLAANYRATHSWADVFKTEADIATYVCRMNAYAKGDPDIGEGFLERGYITSLTPDATDEMWAQYLLDTHELTALFKVLLLSRNI